MIKIAVAEKSLIKKAERQISKNKKKHMDIGLVVTIFILLSIGLMMVLSASAPSALTYEGDSYFYFNSQARNAIIGLCGMFFISMIDYRIYKGRIADLAIIFSILLLALVFVPGLGVTRNQATRWLNLGIQFQPSEVMKVAIIIFLSAKISKYPNSIKCFWKGLFLYLLLLGLIAVLLLLEPHMSATVIILIIAASILFTAGLSWKYIIPVGLCGVGACAFLALTAEYRLKRVLIFLDPWQDKLRRWLANNSIDLCNCNWKFVWSRAW